MPRQTLLAKRSRLTKPPSVNSGQWGTLSEESQSWWGAQWPAGGTTSGISVTPDSSLNLAAVYAARRIISTTLGICPLDVIRKAERNGRPVRLPIPEHPVSGCLTRAPNTDQTPLSFKEGVGMELTGWGNFYAEINWGGPRLYLHPLAASRVTVERASDGLLEYVYSNGDGSGKRLPQSKVVHVPLLGDGVVGKSPITYARESIGVGLAADQFSAAFFGNGLNPSGVLSHPARLDNKGRENLRNALERRHKGTKNAGQLLLLEEGIKYDSVGIPAKDAQFLETRQFQVLDIARWFGIPPHMLADASKATWANITHYDIEFVKYTMLHYFVRVEEELNRKLLWQEPDVCCKFNIKALLRGDMNAEMDGLLKGLTNGIYTLNDVLEILDRNPMEEEGGETRWVSQQYVPIERALNPEPEPEPGEEDEEETQTEETSDEESERSHKQIGEPRTVTSNADEAFLVVFRSAVGQVVALELKAMQTLIRKSDTQEQLFKAVGDFMDKHDERVRECIGPCWQARGLMLGETIDVPKSVGRYVSEVRHLMLDAVRNHGGKGLSTLVDVWSNGRADQVVTQYMDVSRN